MTQARTGDLHIHTDASDGAYGIGEVVRLAHAAGLETIAITDHDTVAAFDGFDGETEVEVIRGVELSAAVEDREAHILGYFLDVESPALRETLKLLQQKRRSRLHTILSRLAEQDIRISAGDVFDLAGGKSVSRLHVAELLIDAGHSTNLYEAFRDFLGPAGSAFVPRPKLTVREAISIIHNAGGATVLAHPRNTFTFEETESFAKDGLDGIEAHYPSHTRADEENALKAADRLDLVVTGGSDFHGRTYARTPIGAVTVSREAIEKLHDRSKRYASGSTA